MSVQDSMPVGRIRKAALAFWALPPQERDEQLQAALERGCAQHPELSCYYDLATLLVQLELIELDRSAGNA